MAGIATGRVYDEPQGGEGTRVLVDRVWPRGMRKDDPRVGTWLKGVAPSGELRKWYGHDPQRRAGFSKKYRAELRDDDHANALAELREMARKGPVLLVTATRDVGQSQCPILKDVLEG